VLRLFHREIGVRILFIDVLRGVAEQSDVKVARRRYLNILQTSCRLPSFKVLTVTSPADEIFTNASSNALAQYFIYLIGGPVSYVYGGHSLAVKLASIGVPFKSSSL